MSTLANNLNAVLFSHAALSADVNGTGIDTTGYESLLIVAKLGTTTGTSATINLIVQDSADNSSFATVMTGDTQALDAGAGTGKVLAANLTKPARRYVRYHLNVSGTSPVAGDVLVSVIRGGGTYSRVGSTDYDKFQTD